MRPGVRGMATVAGIGLVLLLTSYLEGGGCQTGKEKSRAENPNCIYTGHMYDHDIAYFGNSDGRYLVEENPGNMQILFFGDGPDKILDSALLFSRTKEERRYVRDISGSQVLDSLQIVYDRYIRSIDSILETRESSIPVN